jgi:hypothetical protein
MRSKRDGQPIPGTEGRISAAEQAAALGIDKAEPKPAPLPLTPAQERRRMNDEWVEDDLTPPDERSVVDDPSTIAAALGLRPDDFDAVPLGSAPEGQPIPQPGIRPRIEPRPDRQSPGASKTVTTDPPDPAVKAQLAADFRAHAAKVAELAESAKASGDPAREAKAAAQVAASRQVGEALKLRGVL